MKKPDMRSLSSEAREERRRQVIGLRQRGWTYDQIATQMNLSRAGVFNICRRHEREGASDLYGNCSGRSAGRRRMLTEQQELEIRVLISDLMPDQIQMPFALWSRRAVRELIQQQFGLKLTSQGVGLYLARWGFPPQNAVRRPEAVEAWLKGTRPEIEHRAKAEGAEIQWGGEASMRAGDVRSRSGEPFDEASERSVTSCRKGPSVMSIVTSRGQMHWKVVEGAMNAVILIDFLKRLIKDMRNKKVFLILDVRTEFQATPVKAWLAKHLDKIEVFYVPSYDAELKADRMLDRHHGQCDVQASCADHGTLQDDTQ